MEPKFQTSFIPKKPLPVSGGGIQNIVKPHRKGVSIFMTLAVLMFLASLGGVGGAYAWKQFLESKQEGYRQILKEKQKEFNIDSITQLKAISTQIETAKKLLNNHLALSAIFNIIGQFTTEKVRFMSMDLKTEKDGIKISMNGSGSNLSAVAFQSDVLSQLDQYNLRRIVKNPIISNPALDAGGLVGFGFSATISPTPLNYVKLLSPAPTSTSTNL